MQDLGGCRAIMSTCAKVHELAAIYKAADRRSPNKGMEFDSEKDYIASPKPDGYRGVHLIYKYRSRGAKQAAYNGLKIEHQIRSAAQHYWATAVETVSTFTGQSLKTNIGTEDWKRFFSLAGSAIAEIEQCPSVPGCPQGAELRQELQHLIEKLDVYAVVGGLPRVAEKYTGQHEIPPAFVLMELNSDINYIIADGFSREQSAEAQAAYLAAEREHAGNEHIQIVLVAVDSVTALKRAYPNYFMDTTGFMKLVHRFAPTRLRLSTEPIDRVPPMS